MIALTRDRVVTMGGIIAVSSLTWLYLAFSSMSHHGSTRFAAVFLMWSIMMVAMMLPTAAPAIGMFGSFAARRQSATGSVSPTSLFVLGYVAIWTAYSVIAAAGQVTLSRASLLGHTLQGNSVMLSASLLVVAGGFQFTALKEACLSQCRSPFPFLLANWRDGNVGAFTLGVKHGSYCVGCCWALMGLMFVFGSVNLLWMGALSLFMLAEKIAPATWRLSHAAGVVAILWGLFLAAGVVRSIA